MKHFFKIKFASILLFYYSANAQNIPGIYTSAGPGQSICASWEAQLNGSIGDSVISPAWTTSGDGTFSNANALDAVYFPGPADINARSAILTLTANHIGLPYTVSDYMILTIIPSVPLKPEIITGAPLTACPPLTGIILRTNNDPEATNYVWSSQQPGVSFMPPSSADTQAISLYPASSPAYVINVTAFNLCGASPARLVNIRKTVNVSAIKGASVACANTANTYSCNNVPGAVSYKWKSTGGIKFNNNTHLYITTDTVVNAAFQPGFTSGTISVAAMTACFTGSFKTLSISKSLPALTPINGISSICPVTSEIYSVSPVPGTAGYTWTLPANTNGASVTNLVNVNFENSFADSGSLCVAATSICGMTTAPVCKSIIKTHPAMPGNISGPSIGLCGQTVNYSVTPVQGVTYNWNVPPGATVNGSQTGSSIDVNISSDMNQGYIRVSATNNCGTSPLQNLLIKGRPAKPGSITATLNSVNNITTVAQFSSNANTLGSGSSLTWTYPSAASYISGQATSSLSLNWGNDNGIVILSAANSCGSSSREYYVNINAHREIEPPSETNPNVTGKVATDNLMNLQAYPDANHKTLTLTFFASEPAVYFYNLYDESNREVLTESIEANEGVNMIEINMASLPIHIIYRLSLSTGKDSTHINIRMQ